MGLVTRLPPGGGALEYKGDLQKLTREQKLGGIRCKILLKKGGHLVWAQKKGSFLMWTPKNGVI